MTTETLTKRTLNCGGSPLTVSEVQSIVAGQGGMQADTVLKK